MKCMDCDACKQGFFKSKPEMYVCTGTKEPFVIENIGHECTEYPDRKIRMESKYMKEVIKTLIEKEQVSHPSHYGGENNPYEARKVIKAWGLNFNLGNVAKYISRAGKKDLKGDILKSTIEDLGKAKQYLEFEIEELNEQLEAIAYQD